MTHLQPASDDLSSVDPASIARKLVSETDSPAVCVRLYRDVLGIDPIDTRLLEAEARLLKSDLTRNILDHQHANGSWGRLHSSRSQPRSVVPTTEFAVRRLRSLGVSPGHPSLTRAADYLVGLLRGIHPLTERERNQLWETGWQLFAASTLAQIFPRHPAVVAIRDRWIRVAQISCAQGAYDPDREVEAQREVNAIDAPDGDLRYLRITSKYAIELFASARQCLPEETESALLGHIAQSPEGLGYFNVPVAGPSAERPAPRVLDAWIMSLELLIRFDRSRELCNPALDRLARLQRDDGLWDLGRRSLSLQSFTFPLQEGRWTRNLRSIDWTTRILCLLSRRALGGDGNSAAG